MESAFSGRIHRRPWRQWRPSDNPLSRLGLPSWSQSAHLSFSLECACLHYDPPWSQSPLGYERTRRLARRRPRRDISPLGLFEPWDWPVQEGREAVSESVRVRCIRRNHDALSLPLMQPDRLRWRWYGRFAQVSIMMYVKYLRSSARMARGATPQSNSFTRPLGGGGYRGGKHWL